MFFFELGSEIFNNPVVKVFAAQEGVAIGGLHLEHAVANLQDGDVECAAPKIIDSNRSVLLFVEPIGEGGGCWLIDNAQHFKARNFAGVFCRLALGVIEVSWNRNHSLGHGLAKEGFSRFFHLLQDEG